MSLTTQFLDQLTHPQLIDRLDLALSGANLGIWDWDLRDDSVQFDRRWCEMLGLEHAATPMVLTTWSSRVHPDDLDRCYADIRAHLEGRTARYENVHRMRNLAGEWMHILDRGRISGRDEQGKPIRFTGTHFDLTASENAKKAIALHEQELVELVTNLPSAVALMDANLSYIAASAQWCAAFDLGSTSLRGQRHLELRPDTSPRWREILRRALAGERLKADEEAFVDPQTHQVQWLRWSAIPWRRASGEVEGVLVSFDDVSDLVASREERERERVSRLEALAVFAGGVAHEINSPLQVIGIESELLTRELARPTPDLGELRESVRSLSETAQRAMTVTRALRTLSRDSQSDPTEPVPVQTVFDHVKALCQSRFTSSSIELRFVDESNGAVIDGRPAELLHMVLNLLDNAHHAAKLGSCWVRVEASVEAERVLLRCVDGGPGVPKELQSRLMSPFFTTKPTGLGTGLGLSIVKSLVSRTQGSLRFVEEAANTTFELSLPRHVERRT
jgi:PAS domain S-box-containing protein